MADNLPPSSADVTEFGSLNLPEMYGPHRPVMGLRYISLGQSKGVQWALNLRTQFVPEGWS
jgi:hypothetical protein